MKLYYTLLPTVGLGLITLYYVTRKSHILTDTSNSYKRNTTVRYVMFAVEKKIKKKLIIMKNACNIILVIIELK